MNASYKLKFLALLMVRRIIGQPAMEVDLRYLVSLSKSGSLALTV